MVSAPRGPLDDVSKAIIEQLQEDGRRPYASIGKAVGLSEAAVRQRVQKLVDSGVMQIVAVTDPSQTGFARQAMIAITASGDLEAIADLSDIKQAQYTRINTDILVRGIENVHTDLDVTLGCAREGIDDDVEHVFER